MIKLNNEIVNVTIFPDGTSQVWKLTDDQIRYIINNDHIEVHWEFESEAEIFHLIQLADLIHSEYYSHVLEYLKELRLIAPYLPYARQDKAISNLQTFALHSFVNMIGEYYDVVESIDVHPTNYKEFGLIENVFPADYINFAIEDCSASVICYPDKSARERYSYHYSFPECVMEKVRDQLTGDIVGLQFETAPPMLSGENILIIDDLCDGGRTFVETAKILKEFGPANINLYVSHGLFTKGVDIVYQSGISKIYTRQGLVN
jgi:ribose-phosphate pyrophosphokinase